MLTLIRRVHMMRWMSRWLKKLHMYFGLLNFSILLVFGIAGLTATVHTHASPRATPVITTFDFRPPANIGDYEAAIAAFEFLKLPMATAPMVNGVRRDAANNVFFAVYTPNGARVVTLLEKEGKVQLDTRRESIWHFFDNLHGTTVNNRETDLRIRLWTWYNEFAIWSLIFMSATGVYLWLASRPRYRWAQVSFAAGSGIFVLLYAISR